MASLETNIENSEVLKNAGIAITISTVINVVIFYVGRAADAFGSDIINPLTNAELGVTDVIGSNLIFLILGTIVYFVINRFTDNTKTNFRNVAIIGYLLLLANPLQISDLEILTYLFLITMHTISTIIFLFFLVYKD